MDEAAEDMGLLFGFSKLVTGTAGHNLYAVGHETTDELPKTKAFGTAIVDDHVDDAEAALERRMGEKPIEDELGNCALLELENDAHALAVGFVAKVRDTVKNLVPDQVGDCALSASFY